MNPPPPTPSTPAADGPAADFPPASYGDWRRLVESELKGAPFDKRMFTRTFENITLKPLYLREDVANLPHLGSFPGFPPFVRGGRAAGYGGQPWAISQEITCSSPTEFNHEARNSLAGHPERARPGLGQAGGSRFRGAFHRHTAGPGARPGRN
jgi:methylmalonyl-CoA mutase